MKIHQNHLAVFINSVGYVFEMVDFLKEKFPVEQQPPIVKYQAQVIETYQRI